MSSQVVRYWPLILMHLLLSSGSGATAGKVPAIIVFGDSTVDSGNNDYIPTVARGNFPPYGRDFEGGVATGRFTNGRLVTDFMSEALGLASSVPAYLDGSYTVDQLASGVSFASGGTGLDAMTAKIARKKKPGWMLHDMEVHNRDVNLFSAILRNAFRISTRTILQRTPPSRQGCFAIGIECIVLFFCA
ncbi:GDSL esterase/lipase At2g04570 isoform X2 [Triticum aestivum]|uniref:GDSL esterase/lipase At2g04570 isoform X2 n=1 Tax=Triticum aestivum TaxID=4565 RepID=UPI0008427C0E|nr:GDSL esterase/lipase At2g04570-like isoform X2 [Triticum aestivum]